MLNPDGNFSTLNINNDPLANANGINVNGVVVGATAGQAFMLNAGLPYDSATGSPGTYRVRDRIRS